jgi:outer membrane protein OmpA-like peptidoglycan-associated protein
MMKKINFCLLLFLIAIMLLPVNIIGNTQETQDLPEVKKEKKKPRKFDVEIAYAYREESLVINETDLIGTHFIKSDQSEDMVINGAESMDWGKTDYSDGERMYINKGSNDGLNEGDEFLILGKGEAIDDPANGKSMGTYYLKKSLADIYCIYEDKTIITLKKGVHPVQIGDIVIPYQEKEPLFQKKLNYKKCKLPQGAIEGNVVYCDIYTGAVRQLVSEGQYVTINLGNSVVNYADWVLLFRQLKPHLPPIIVGTGIVIDSQNLSATVKVIESAFQVDLNTRLMVLEMEDDDSETSASDIDVAASGDNENIPIQKLRKEGDSASGESMEVNVLFNINQKNISERYQKELINLSEFIRDKSKYSIILRGYSCSIGGFEHNLKLSNERVQVVKKYLMDNLKIGDNFFETYHYGEKDAPFDNSSEKQRRKNRLVNVEVRGK